ncbi:exonuclease domain-containing protein [Rhizobium sp. SGZ-381]|uniref:3'-5' exonuclease n=1 Tax=Rhizobium sp. SGZ-381 TaxID=3342800 RepID=UPI00366AC793
MQKSYSAFFDVETTGFEETDRIVSFACIKVDLEAARSGAFDCSLMHLIFDPGKKSHPSAEAVHGYNDWLLRHQMPFYECAEDIFQLLDSAKTLHAHHLEFDYGFVSRQLGESGLELRDKNLICTMQDYRNSFSGKSNLEVAAKRFGLKRSGRKHSSLEDAWLCMGVYLGNRGIRIPQAPSEILTPPTNLQRAPPRPLGSLPRRKPFKSTLPPIYREMLENVINLDDHSMSSSS